MSKIIVELDKYENYPELMLLLNSNDIAQALLEIEGLYKTWSKGYYNDGIIVDDDKKVYEGLEMMSAHKGKAYISAEYAIQEIYEIFNRYGIDKILDKIE